MISKPTVQPLGAVLQQAGLVSPGQLALALQEQRKGRTERIGVILAKRGWIERATANFFADEWPQVLDVSDAKPIGHYCCQASLLSDEQVAYILGLQKQVQLKFGVLAVAYGWLNRATVEFFLTCLSQKQATPFESDRASSADFHTLDYWEALRERILENEAVSPFSLVGLYQQVLQKQTVRLTHSLPQTTLLKLGVVKHKQQRLEIAHPTYAQVMNQTWVNQSLEQLRPFDFARMRYLNLTAIARYPYRVLQEVGDWTGFHADLLPKVRQILTSVEFINGGEEVVRIEALMRQHFVEHWASNLGGDHLQELATQLQFGLKGLLLKYRTLVQLGTTIMDGSAAEAKLMALGLINQEGSQVRVANRLYATVFDATWCNRQLQTWLQDDSPNQALATALSLANNPARSSPSQGRPSQLSPRRLSRRPWLWGLVALGLGSLGAIAHVNWLEPTPVTTPSIQPAPALDESDTPNAIAVPDAETPTSEPVTKTPPTQPETSAIPAPGSISPETSTLPTFPPGRHQSDVLYALGEPTRRSEGYWPNSTAWLYKNYRPDIDFGLIFDRDTNLLRQTEVAFPPTESLSVIQTTLSGLLDNQLSPEVASGLQRVYAREQRQYPFQVGDWQGIIERNPEDRIYMGIWQSDFH